MAEFFQTIVDQNLYREWANTLDWLFNDQKFEVTRGWSSRYVRSLTNKIKGLEHFSEGKTYICGSISSLEFPKRQCRTVKAFFSKDGSECKEFIRHIRNGIAHGNTRCFPVQGELFIEIKDYSNRARATQTAYICFPVAYIIKIHKLYRDVQASINGERRTKSAKKR